MEQLRDILGSRSPADRVLLVLFCCVLLPAAGALLLGAKPARFDQALLTLFPQDSAGIMYFNVSELRENELIREYVLERSEFQIRERADEIFQGTGLDPFMDIDQVMVGRTATNDVLAVARAGYNLRDVEARFQALAAGVEPYRGFNIYRPILKPGWSVSFADDLVLIGENGSVKGAIDRTRDPSLSAMQNPKLLAAVRSFGDGNQAWGVGMLVRTLIPQVLTPPMALDLVAALDSVTYQVRVDSTVTAVAAAVFTSSEAARRTGDLLEGVIALGKMQTEDSPALSALLGQFQIDTVDALTQIRFTADQDLLERVTEAGLPFPPLRGD